MTIHEFVHETNLLLLLHVSRKPRIYGATNNKQIHFLTQARTAAVPIHQPGQVLYMIQSGHGEKNWFIAISQHAPGITPRVLSIDKLINFFMEMVKPPLF